MSARGNVRCSNTIALVAALMFTTACAGETPTRAPSTPSVPDFAGLPPTAPPVWSTLTSHVVTEPFSGTGNQFLFDATAYGDGFVVVGEDFQSDALVNGAIWFSRDGTSWTTIDVDDGELADAEIDQVATDGHKLVAIGRQRADGSTDELVPIIWLSEDGTSWQRVANPHEQYGGVLIEGLTGGTGGFVAWGSEAGLLAAVFHSQDGRTWDRVSGDVFEGTGVGDVQQHREGFVAVGAFIEPPKPPGSVLAIGGPNTSKAAAWWSGDGRTWALTSAADGFGLGSLEVGAHGMLAQGRNECSRCIQPLKLWSSVDGGDWRIVGDDLWTFPSYSSDGARIIRYDYQDSGNISSSTDGLAWDDVDNVGRREHFGLAVGTRGILVLRRADAAGLADQADGAVEFLAAE